MRRPGYIVFRQDLETDKTKGSAAKKELRASLADRDPSQAQIATRLVELLDARPDMRLRFADAQQQSETAGSAPDDGGVLAVGTEGTIWVGLRYLRATPPFDDTERLRALVDELNGIPGVAIPPGERDGPNAAHIGLADDESVERFVKVIEDALDLMARARPRRSLQP